MRSSLHRSLVVMTALSVLAPGCKKKEPTADTRPSEDAGDAAALLALLGSMPEHPVAPTPTKPAIVLGEGPSLHVLYRGSFLGKDSSYGSLVGMRPAVHQGVVREGSGLIQTFDYARGSVVEQWQPPADTVGYVDPTNAAKIAPELRWADLVRSLPTQPPADVRPWGRFLMSPDGTRVLYEARIGATGDPLHDTSTTAVMLADAKGAHARALGATSIDTISFSPDSRMLAWIVLGRVPTSPHGGVRAGEPVVPSEVFVADVNDAGAKPRHVTRPNELLHRAVWSRDGSRLYLLSGSEYGVGKACLLEVDPKTLDSAREVHCPPSFTVLLDLAVAPDGHTAVLYDRATFVGVDLATGKVGAQHRPNDVAMDDLRVSSSGIVVTGATREGLVLLDLATDRETRIKPASGHFGGVGSSRWLDDRRLALLHQGKGVQGFELIALDVASALGP